MGRRSQLVGSTWVNSGASGYGGLLLPGVPLLDGLTWAPVFGRHPIVANFVPLRTVTVNSTASWNAAIAGLLPGDRIHVTASLTSAITRNISAKSGTAANPWMIEFAPGVTLAGASPTTQIQLLTIHDCDWFILKNLRMTSVNQALKMRTCNNVFLDTCYFYNLGQEAVAYNDHCRYFDAWNCMMWDTGRNLPLFGEGYYFGTDENNNRWQDPNYNSDLSTIPHAEYISVRQCKFGRDVTAEWIEFKPGARYCYVIGCVGDGIGYLNDGAGFKRAPIQAKGSDLFFFWNEMFYPHESMFHAYGANSTGTMGTGGWEQRHTYYGNIAHLDESTYTGANQKNMIRADGNRSHVVYDNNVTTGGFPIVVTSNGTTITTTPTP